ncbi:unnamed protein product [Calypogeia fissa]
MASCKAESSSTMDFMVMTLLLFSAFLVHRVQAGRGVGVVPDRSLVAADYYSWCPGHATFYGGPDAAGTDIWRILWIAKLQTGAVLLSRVAMDKLSLSLPLPAMERVWIATVWEIVGGSMARLTKDPSIN